MIAALWALMMLIWLAGLGFGVWWVWPHFERMALTWDLVAAIMWLVMGTLAWIVAFDMGRRRYWRR
jgi:hypothetical protein